ncbi:MAG TPA: RDD family protein [Candidatus Acidoferrum sp.]|nr:RDD family protein [Candidatus Acidoferrum sp.]
MEGQAANSRTVAAGVPLPRAGFWIRAVAALIDLFLLIVPFAIFVSFSAAAMGISNPFFNHGPGMPLNEALSQFAPLFLTLCVCFFVAEGWLYFALSESSRWHATLGKRLLGLYVADIAGKPVDFWRASMRFCSGRLLAHVPFLGGYYFVIDCLCVGLMPGKRAIHDTISGCLVLREGSHSFFVR